MLDLRQFRELIVRPTLIALDLHTESAEDLLVGTALVESRLTYIKQLPNGPAIGVYQMEPFTYRDLKARISLNYSKLSSRALNLLNMDFFPDNPDYLMGNLVAATIFARFKYYFDKEPLPKTNDFEGLAKYYKRIYNTPLGKADIVDVTKIFRAVVLDYHYHL